MDGARRVAPRGGRQRAASPGAGEAVHVLPSGGGAGGGVER